MSLKYVVLGAFVLLSFGFAIYIYFIQNGETLASTDAIAVNVDVEKVVLEPVIPQGLIEHQVPFTPQAPLGEWFDPRQQYGCEEAIAVMAMHWVRGESNSLPLVGAREEILAITEFQQENYGMFEDTSVSDTETRIFRDYYGYLNTEVRTGISVEDIKEELYRGNVIFVPINGRTIQNLYYTPPGPLRHTIMVIGYDPETHTFITHDPGTKHGAYYPYQEDILAASLQNYATGLDEPIEDMPSSMLVIYGAKNLE